jgi:Ca2+-binding EF-hand superfamily protein
MKKIIVLSSAIALSLAANITVAQPGGGWGKGQSGMNGDQAQMRPDRRQARIDWIMKRFDVNQDEQITLDEVQSVRIARFNKMDVDGNGLVNSEELEGFRAKMREEYQNNATQNRRGRWQGMGRSNQLERLDNNGDGQISVSEFTAKGLLFNRFDADKNGIITKEELNQRRRRRQ